MTIINNITSDIPEFHMSNLSYHKY